MSSCCACTPQNTSARWVVQLMMANPVSCMHACDSCASSAHTIQSLQVKSLPDGADLTADCPDHLQNSCRISHERVDTRCTHYVESDWAACTFSLSDHILGTEKP